MSSNGPKIDGAAVHHASVERAHELGDAAVSHARAVKDALNLPEAPVSPNAPPHVPAPHVPAPPYPPVRAKAEAPAPEVIAQEPSQQEPSQQAEEPQTDG